MIRLADAAVKIAAAMLDARGQPEQPADDSPINDFAGVLATLQRHYEAAEAPKG